MSDQQGSNQEPPEIVGIDYIAKMLHRSPKTVRSEVARNPDSLPPRIQIPGSNRVLWFKQDAIDWLRGFMAKPEEPKPKRGRPSTLGR